MKSKSKLALRVLYSLFLIGTGVMTIGFQFNPPEWPQSPAGEFLISAGQTGYLFAWVGFFKALTGIFILIPKTEKLAYLMVLPYTVNIILWVSFVAHEWLLIGIPNFLASVALIAIHYKSYLPILNTQQA